MHEQSIADCLIDLVMEQLIESGAAGVNRVIVEVGELSGIVPAALRSAFVIAIQQEPALRSASLHIRPVSVTVYCGHCNAERPAESVQAMRCVDCNEPSTRVVRGRELQLIGIEVIDAATNA